MEVESARAGRYQCKDCEKALGCRRGEESGWGSIPLLSGEESQFSECLSSSNREGAGAQREEPQLLLIFLSDWWTHSFVQSIFNFLYTRHWMCGVAKDIEAKRTYSKLIMIGNYRQCLFYSSERLSVEGLYSQSYGFSSSHVWIWELSHKEV